MILFQFVCGCSLIVTMARMMRNHCKTSNLFKESLNSLYLQSMKVILAASLLDLPNPWQLCLCRPAALRLQCFPYGTQQHSGSPCSSYIFQVWTDTEVPSSRQQCLYMQRAGYKPTIKSHSRPHTTKSYWGHWNPATSIRWETPRRDPCSIMSGQDVAKERRFSRGSFNAIYYSCSIYTCVVICRKKVGLRQILMVSVNVNMEPLWADFSTQHRKFYAGTGYESKFPHRSALFHSFVANAPHP